MPVIWSVPAIVLRIVDGDTAHLLLDLGWHISYEARCRIIGINSPEIATAAGLEAKAFAETLLPIGGAVTFASHSLDKYGRPLGAITDADGEDFGAHMLSAGHAVALKD
jgi:endonuclease YncB( thermonuclease family)